MARRRLLRDPDDEQPTDGNEDAWLELGSDMDMDFDVLARVRREALEVELSRATADRAAWRLTRRPVG